MISWLENLYRALWTRVGGKPWTEDEQKQPPLVFLLVFLGLGLLVGKLAGKYWWQITLGFLLGILCGHFWW
jgi:hypothetical protein